MGEIFHALEVLNRSMKLGLNGEQLLRAEMGFKSALAMQGNPDPGAVRLRGDPAALAEQFETVVTLRARAQKFSVQQLSTMAAAAVKTPRTRVDAATFKKIDTAISAGTRATAITKGGVLKTTAPKAGALKAAVTKAPKTR